MAGNLGTASSGKAPEPAKTSGRVEKGRCVPERSRRFLRGAVRILTAAVFACSSAWADLVYLQDGRVIEGEVRDRGDSYSIRTKAGMSIEVRKDEVLKVEKTASPLQIYEKRLKTLAPDDARGHYELALFCIENKFEKEAKNLLGNVVGMASPFLKDAKLKLAGLLEKSDPKRAIKLYDDVAFRFNDPDAAIKARDLRRTLDSRRANAFEDGLQAMAAGRLAEARSELERAYSMTVGISGRGPGEMDVLEKLAQVRAKMEEAAAFATETGTSTANVEFCTQCPESCGWTTCYKCGGKGTVERVIPAYRTILGEVVPERKVQDPCPVCRGTKMWRCQGCAGTGISLANLPRDVQEQVKSLGSVAHGREHDDFIMACLTMNDQARSLRLKLQPGQTPRYGTTQVIRDLIKALPVDRDFAGTPEFARVRALWSKMRSEQRAQFLCGYALELTKNSLPAFVRADASGAAAEVTDLKALRLTSPVVSATELTAMPEMYDGEWIITWVTYKGKDEKLSDDERLALKVTSERFCNIHPFLYTERAKAAHEQIAKGKQDTFYRTMLARYDYSGLARRVGALAEGERIQLFGRMQVRPGKCPESMIEVWDVDVRLSPADEKLLMLVRKPVTFNFSDTPLTEVTILLSALCDTKITASVPANARVNLTGRAVRQPLGIALRDLLKNARLAWIFDGDNAIMIVQDPPRAEIEKAERILRKLE